jgi:hypothetical protein
MPPSSPSDLFWTALAPLVQQLEALGRVLEGLLPYYAWCVGCAAGVALLLLGGLVVKEARDGTGESPGGAPDEDVPHSKDAPSREDPPTPERSEKWIP